MKSGDLFGGQVMGKGRESSPPGAFGGSVQCSGERPTWADPLLPVVQAPRHVQCHCRGPSGWTFARTAVSSGREERSMGAWGRGKSLESPRESTEDRYTEGQHGPEPGAGQGGRDGVSLLVGSWKLPWGSCWTRTIRTEIRLQCMGSKPGEAVWMYLLTQGKKIIQKGE